jgi:hypothetical protein
VKNGKCWFSKKLQYDYEEHQTAITVKLKH